MTHTIRWSTSNENDRRCLALWCYCSLRYCNQMHQHDDIVSQENDVIAYDEKCSATIEIPLLACYTRVVSQNKNYYHFILSHWKLRKNGTFHSIISSAELLRFNCDFGKIEWEWPFMIPMSQYFILSDLFMFIFVRPCVDDWSDEVSDHQTSRNQGPGHESRASSQSKKKQQSDGQWKHASNGRLNYWHASSLSIFKDNDGTSLNVVCVCN